jgi:hypothetical protein
MMHVDRICFARYDIDTRFGANGSRKHFQNKSRGRDVSALVNEGPEVCKQRVAIHNHQNLVAVDCQRIEI